LTLLSFLLLPPPTNILHLSVFVQVAYTLWVRFMNMLSNDKLFSAHWAKPVPLAFFQDDADYQARFDRFSLAEKLEVERLIKVCMCVCAQCLENTAELNLVLIVFLSVQEYGNMCDNGAPVINYDECSSEFTELWRESARSMQAHVRKNGATIVPGKKALIWPGLSLGHFLGSSVPAWSSHARNISEVGFSEVCFCGRHAAKLSHVLATHNFFYYT
jgi:hypothetical protein